MPAHQAGKPRVSSTMTKSNPRPRKYATASERQAAYRARAPEVCFRAEAKTVDNLDRIADTLDRSRADVLLSMTKFALANHDWARFGLTHKPLPYGYGMTEERAENPQPIWKRTRPKSLGKPVPLTPKQKAAAKKRAAAAGRKYPNLVDNIAASRMENPTVKKPTPAQLAARARFAEMARSGAFKRKAKRKANPQPVKMKIRGSETPDNPEGIVVTEAGALRWAKQNMPKDLKRAGFVPSVVAGARGWSINYGAAVPGHSSYARNPRKKTVSQKISQLVREGYPQKQAVAVALSEQCAGKVKRNPVGNVANLKKRYNTVLLTIAELRDDQKRRAAGLPDELEGYTDAEIKKLISMYQAKAADLRDAINMYKPNPATGRKGSGTKLNPIVPEARSRLPSNFKYGVQTKATENWGLQAAFKTKAEAVDYAHAIAKNYPRLPIRVITFTGGPI